MELGNSERSGDLLVDKSRAGLMFHDWKGEGLLR